MHGDIRGRNVSSLRLEFVRTRTIGPPSSSCRSSSSCLPAYVHDHARSYARAIAANPDYAPAYRDRGVLRDLYLDQPAAALGDFEQYRKLTGEDKPVAMWIAELAHRTGRKVPPDAPRPATSAGVSAQPPAQVSKPPDPPPQARN